MSTFHELQQKLTKLKYRKAIVDYMIQHFDEEFRPSSSGPAKKRILTEDKIPVPDDVFEEEASFLTEDLKGIDEEIEAILVSTIAPPKAPEVVVATQEEVPTPPVV